MDKPNGDRRTAAYYVEDVTKDANIPFGSAKRVLGCGRVVTTNYTSKTNDPVSWVITTVDGEKTEMLDVEGILRENPYLAEEVALETDETVSAVIPAARQTAESSAEASAETTAE